MRSGFDGPGGQKSIRIFAKMQTMTRRHASASLRANEIFISTSDASRYSLRDVERRCHRLQITR